MSDFEEQILAKWQEINRVHPPAEHLQSTLREKKATKPTRVLHTGCLPTNTDRNKQILQYSRSGYSPADIARVMRIRKNVVIGVLDRNVRAANAPVLKDVDKKEVQFSVNPENLEFPYILTYKGKKTVLAARHYIIFKALLYNKNEWYPTKELLGLYYKDRDLPKTAQNCFRKQVRCMGDIIECVNLTTIVKPRYGYKLIEF